MRQMTGVSIWQTLVQGCLLCSCAFLRKSALTCAFSFLGWELAYSSWESIIIFIVDYLSIDLNIHPN